MKKITLLFGALMLFVVSCHKDSDVITEEELLEEDLICEDCGIEITKDNTRLTQYDQVIDVKPNTNRSSKNSKSSMGAINLRLKATVDPLYIDYNGQKRFIKSKSCCCEE